MKRTAYITVLFIAGCKSIPMPEMPPVGPEPTEAQAEQVIRDYFIVALKDPASVTQFKITRGPLMKQWHMTRSAPWRAGWLVCFQYNAKNSYGGYVGLKPGGVYIMGDAVRPYLLEGMLDIFVPPVCQ